VNKICDNTIKQDDSDEHPNFFASKQYALTASIV